MCQLKYWMQKKCLNFYPRLFLFSWFRFTFQMIFIFRRQEAYKLSLLFLNRLLIVVKLISSKVILKPWNMLIYIYLVDQTSVCLMLIIIKIYKCEDIRHSDGVWHNGMCQTISRDDDRFCTICTILMEW